MRISKLCLVVCAAILCAAIPTVRADDNPAQAAARAALEEQMRALDTQPAPTNRAGRPHAGATGPAPHPANPLWQPRRRRQIHRQRAKPIHAAAARGNDCTAGPADPLPPPRPGQTVQPPTNPPERPCRRWLPRSALLPAQTTAPARSTASSSGNSLFGPVPPAFRQYAGRARCRRKTNRRQQRPPRQPPSKPRRPLRSNLLPMEPSQTTTTARPFRQEHWV